MDPDDCRTQGRREPPIYSAGPSSRTPLGAHLAYTPTSARHRVQKHPTMIPGWRCFAPGGTSPRSVHHSRARAAPHAYRAEREDSMPRQYVAQKKPLLSQNAYEQHKQTYPGTPSNLILWRSNCVLRQIKHTMRSLSEILTTRPHSRPPMCARRHTPTHAFVLYGTHAFVIYDTC